MPKKYILITLFIFLLCMSGCSKNSSQTSVDMSKLCSDMLAADTSLPDMLTTSSNDENGESNFVYLADMDYSKVDSYFYAYSSTGTAYEIAVICLKASSDVSEAETALNTHITNRVHTFESYSPEQVSSAENAKIVKNGRYVALIMCDSKNDVIDVFNSHTK